MTEPRFVVREITGILKTGESGLSVVVLDRLCNYRIMGQFRTEDYSRCARYGRHQRVRNAGEALAERLNAEVGA